VQQFVELPPDGLGRRFGADALAFYKEASEQERRPLVPAPPPVPVQTLAEFEYPEADATRLLFYMKRLLPALLERLASWHQGLVELVVEMTLDDRSHVVRSVRPADATLDAAVILDLARLRIAGADISAGVVEMTVTAHGKRVGAGQLSLFWNQPKRDVAAADRALARLRAEFGREAVVWARPRDAHLPEASFTWEPLTKMKSPRTHGDEGSRENGGSDADDTDCEHIGKSGSFARPLVRRMFDRAVQLPARERHEPDGWLIRGLEQGPAVRLRGPYVVSGGWWVREVHREYYFVETQRGDVLWIYYDRQRRSWMLQGEI
jgi:protein ImuB